MTDYPAQNLTAMGFDPNRFAALARVIVEQADLHKEARVRTTIGRSYYALFLVVRTAIRAAEGRPTDGRADRIDHGALPNVLYGANQPKFDALAKTLEDLYAARMQADYVLDPEPKWAKICTSPEKAAVLARRAEAAVREAASLDFSLFAGKL